MASRRSHHNPKRPQQAIDDAQPVRVDQPPKTSKVSFLQMRLRAGYHEYSPTILTCPDGTTLH